VTIAAETTMGRVKLTVRDLGVSRSFYERVLGLEVVADVGPVLTLAADGGSPLVELRGDPEAPPLDHRLTGLFHFALLVPTRRDLALALVRLVRAGWQLTGASDHLVSEALYLDDPDGNGIEIYRDRPRSEWTHDQSGELRMATLPLDLNGLIGELGEDVVRGAEGRIPGMPAGTRMGHVHLQVAELRETEAFYGGVLGFDVTVRTYPGALFVSAGGYHHHIGLNTWNSRGAGPPVAGAVGLRAFEVVLPDGAQRDLVLDRLEAAGLPSEAVGDGTLVRDPSGNPVLLTQAA
jgi:catechol 2,3-dioxygenase